MKLTKIYVVRHAQSTHNAGIYNGEEMGEIQLTKKGEQEARLRAVSFKKIRFDAAFSSDYIRAKRTAEIILLEKKLALQTTALIRERIYSDYYVHNREKVRQEMKKELQKLSDTEKLGYKHFPEMESAKEGAERLQGFLREIAVAYKGKTVLVVCHGNIMRSFLNLIGWAKFDELMEGSIDNTGYFVLESDVADFFVREAHGVHKTQGGKRIM